MWIRDSALPARCGSLCVDAGRAVLGEHDGVQRVALDNVRRFIGMRAEPATAILHFFGALAPKVANAATVLVLDVLENPRFALPLLLPPSLLFPPVAACAVPGVAGSAGGLLLPACSIMSCSLFRRCRFSTTTLLNILCK